MNNNKDHHPRAKAGKTTTCSSPQKLCLWVLCVGACSCIHIFSRLVGVEPTNAVVTTARRPIIDPPREEDKSAPSLRTQGLPPTLLQALLDDWEPVTGCGYVKCFFPSRSNPSTGWLVMRSHRFSKSLRKSLPIYPIAARTWEFLQEKNATHILHFYLQAPFKTGPLSATHRAIFKSKFPSLIHNSSNNNASICPPSTCRLWEGSPGGYVVQRVQRAPDTALLWKFLVDDDNAQNYTWRLTPSWEEFVQHNNNLRQQDSKLSFLRSATSQLDQLVQLLNQQPAWAVDLQFLLTTSGTLYHLDLDRLWESAELNPPGWRDKYRPENAIRAVMEFQHQVAASLQANGTQE